MTYGFRCKACGHLHAAEHAGECELPHGCVVCGGGVVFHHSELAKQLTREGITSAEIADLATQIAKCDPASKRLVPENWEVLADCDESRLTELGLEPKHVCRHTPLPKEEEAPQAPKHVQVTAGEKTATEDRA